MSRKERRAEKSLSRSKKNGSSSAVQETLNKAVRHHQAGEWPAAIQLYRQILATDPHHADSLHLLGMLSCQTGQHETGIGLIRQAIQIKGNTFLYHFNLGTILKQQGRLDEAAVCYERALALDSRNAETHRNLGSVLNEQGKRDEAVSHFQKCLELDSKDPYGVRLVLAGMGAEAMPEKASETYLQNVYAARASRWDEGSSAANSYRGHELVVEAFNHLCAGTEKLDILDAGCGTGLVGALLRGRARRLDGVDLSQAMLDKAKTKNIYDHLHRGDLVQFQLSSPEKYDVITCAATLIHFGDLNPAFHAAAVALRGNGLFISTLFPNDDETDENGVAVASAHFAEGGCYTHGRNYIRHLAKANGFTVERLDTAVHEHTKEQPVTCLVAALRRCSR